MAYIALMAVLISVCSWLSVPAAIPFTMQTYAVFTALLLLGGRRGSIAVAVYIALGAVGLPVFSGFAGGAAGNADHHYAAVFHTRSPKIRFLF